MDKQQQYDQLKKMALADGIALFGVADVSAVKRDFLIPPAVAERFDFAISLGFRLSKAALDTVAGAPNQIYYFHYQRINMLLDQTSLKIAAAIQAQGFDALPVPASQVIDWQKQLGSLSHREIARLAGHGWYGRNNLLVNPRFGSQVRYVTILTDLPLPADAPVAGGCGDCRACSAACPAGAITEAGFDRDKCHQKLKEFMKTERIGQMICGVCLQVCPGSGPKG
jgi:epoxyqueuosine reductase QueG